MGEDFEEAGRYTKALGTVAALVIAANSLMEDIRGGDPIDLDEAATAICDALQSLLRIEDRPNDGQLLGAVTKWLDEEGLEVYGMTVRHGR